MSLFNILQNLYVGGTVTGSLNQPTTHYKNMSTPVRIALGGSLVLGIELSAKIIYSSFRIIDTDKL